MGSLDRSRDYKVAITLDGQWILAKQQHTKLIVQHPATGIHEKVLNLRPARKKHQIQNVSLAGKSINGNWLILGFADNTFTEWYLPQTFEQNESKTPFLIRAISSNNRWALRETKNGSIQIQDLFNGKIVHRLSKKDCINIGFFSSLSNVIVFNTGNSLLLPSLYIWDFNYKKTTKILSAYSIELSQNDSFTLSPDEQLYVAGFKTGVVEIYELQHDHRLGVLSGHPMPVTCVAISPDNRQVVSGSEDGTLKVWNLEDSNNLRVINFKLDNKISACALHQEENFIVAGDEREQIHVFEEILPNSTLSKNIIEVPEPVEEIPPEQPTIVSKRVRLQGIPGDDFFFELQGTVFGPGNLLIRLYNQNRLVYEYEHYIQESMMSSLPWINLPSIPWEEDLKGFVMLKSPEGNNICIVDFTVNCSIKDESVLEKYKHLQQLTIKDSGLFSRNSNRESHLIEFLQFQENLFGVHHSETKKTIDELIELYQNQEQDNDVQVLEQKKQEIQRSYKKEEIIIAGENSWGKIIINENDTSNFLHNSYIRLYISPEKIVDSDPSPNLEEVPDKTAMPLGRLIKQELEELQSLLSALREPDINRLEYLGRSWDKFKSTISILQLREGWESFLHLLRRHNQFARFLQNPRNFPYFSTAKIMIGFFVVALLSFIVGQFTASIIDGRLSGIRLNIGDLLTSLIISTGAFCAGALSASWLGALIVAPFCIKADIVSQHQSFDISNNTFVIDGISKQESKQLATLLIIVFSLLVICLFIPFLLFGTTVGGVWGAKLGSDIGMGLGAWLRTNKYWFLVFLCTTTTWIGDFAEWLFKRKRTRASNVLMVLIVSSLIAIFGAKKYIGSTIWFLGWWQTTDKIFPIARGIFTSIRSLLTIVTGVGFSILISNYFNDDLFLSIAVRASSGALIAIGLTERPKTIWFGALAGAVAGISLSTNPPLEISLWLIDRALAIVGMVVLSVVGLFVIGGIVGVLCFGIPITYALVGNYLLFNQIADDMQHRGYSKVFAIFILILIVFLASGLGLATSFLI